MQAQFSLHGILANLINNNTLAVAISTFNIHHPMTIIKFPSKPSEPHFFNDIREDGYHILSLDNLKIPNYYPRELPAYPGVSLENLEVDDVITIRVFFRVGEGKNFRVDGGLIDLKVEHIEDDKVLAAITTQLPKGFALKTGDSIEVYQYEILYKADVSKS